MADDTQTDDLATDDHEGAGDTLESLKADRDKWKALSRKHEGTARQNAEAARRLQEMEDQNKTEAQKLADKVSAAEIEASSAKIEAIRLRVALRKGLTEAQAKRLLGETEAEMEADADELIASFGPSSGANDLARRPKEKLRSGATPASQQTTGSMNDFIRRAAGR